MGKWPSEHVQLTKIRLSDDCGENSVPSTVVRGYDLRKLGGHLENIGSNGPGRLSTHKRPDSVENRTEFGYSEGDLMQFRTQRGNLHELCERKLRFAIAAPLKTETAIKTGEAQPAVLETLPPEARKAVASHNGTEFTPHQDLTAAPRTEAFSCDPHSPWQRGTIENTNGIFRRDMPRKTGRSDYSAWDIVDLALAINSTPRKCLGFQTSAGALLDNIKRHT